jgi:hypothetical protein
VLALRNPDLSHPQGLEEEFATLYWPYGVKASDASYIRYSKTSFAVTLLESSDVPVHRQHTPLQIFELRSRVLLYVS